MPSVTPLKRCFRASKTPNWATSFLVKSSSGPISGIALFFSITFTRDSESPDIDIRHASFKVEVYFT